MCPYHQHNSYIVSYYFIGEKVYGPKFNSKPEPETLSDKTELSKNIKYEIMKMSMKNDCPPEIKLCVLCLMQERVIQEMI